MDMRYKLDPSFVMTTEKVLTTINDILVDRWKTRRIKVEAPQFQLCGYSEIKDSVTLYISLFRNVPDARVSMIYAVSYNTTLTPNVDRSFLTDLIMEQFKLLIDDVMSTDIYRANPDPSDHAARLKYVAYRIRTGTAAADHAEFIDDAADILYMMKEGGR